MKQRERDKTGIGLAAILLGFCCSLHIIIAIGGFAVLYGFVENNLTFLAAAGFAMVLFISFYLKKRGKTCCNTERPGPQPNGAAAPVTKKTLLK